MFQSLRGVTRVEQGFVAADPPHDSFSEAVRLTYDPDVIDLSVLINVHLRTHASTHHHSMRGKYRSAVYVVDDPRPASAIIKALQPEFSKKIITQVLPLQQFERSDARFRNYYQNGPERPFCKTYIDPKLAKIRREFSAWAP